MKKFLQVSVAPCVLLLLGALAIAACAGKGPKAGDGSEGIAALSTCPHTSPTTVPIALVVTAPGVITAPSPGLCPGDTAVWTVENKCSTCGKVKVKIDKRVRRNSSTCASSTTMQQQEDCFKKKAGVDCKPEKADVEFGAGPQPLGDCEIKSGAFNGCYKYELKGTYDIDPEVEVQGGVGGLDTKGSPGASASPSP